MYNTLVHIPVQYVVYMYCAMYISVIFLPLLGSVCIILSVIVMSLLYTSVATILFLTLFCIVTILSLMQCIIILFCKNNFFVLKFMQLRKHSKSKSSTACSAKIHGVEFKGPTVMAGLLWAGPFASVPCSPPSSCWLHGGVTVGHRTMYSVIRVNCSLASHPYFSPPPFPRAFARGKIRMACETRLIVQCFIFTALFCNN